MVSFEKSYIYSHRVHSPKGQRGIKHGFGWFGNWGRGVSVRSDLWDMSDASDLSGAKGRGRAAVWAKKWFTGWGGLCLMLLLV
jgi:hypothetical protein